MMRYLRVTLLLLSYAAMLIGCREHATATRSEEAVERASPVEPSVRSEDGAEYRAAVASQLTLPNADGDSVTVTSSELDMQLIETALLPHVKSLDVELAVRSLTTVDSSDEQPPPVMTDESVIKVAAAQPRRFVVLCPTAPLVVDLVIEWNGQSFDEAVLKFADRMLQSVAKDHDGDLSWETVASVMNQRAMAMSVGEIPVRQRELLFRSYDRNGNQRVDPDELIRFVNRQETSFDWIILRSIDISDDASSLPWMRLLDANGDGQIDANEIAGAAEVLAAHDADDDGVLHPAELPFANLEDGRSTSPTTNYRSAGAVYVGPNTDWGALLHRLQETYSWGAPLLVEDVAQWPQAFADLDRDDDGTIWDDELQAIGERDADVSVHVRLGPKPSKDSPSLAVEARECDCNVLSTIAVKIQCVGGVSLAIQLEDEEMAARDPLIEPASEITDAVPATTAAAEENVANDFEVKPYFLPRVEIGLQPDDDGALAALDTNRDGCLSAAEILNGPQALLRLDRNGDGLLSANEMHQGMVVTIRLANFNNSPRSGFARASAPRGASSHTALWFRAMDANRDGVINRCEFLGELADFDRADADQDGTLTWEEAQALER